MLKEKLYISTIASDAAGAAELFGAGIEIAEYCTAWNMDEKFEATDKKVREELREGCRCTLHAPYNELFPCAIDPRARQLAAERYRQAIALARAYGASKLIVHGGYNPWIYYPVWYVEQSVDFWKKFMSEDHGVKICLENVLEEEPDWLVDIIKAVDDPGLGMCLDLGHVNAYSKLPAMDWLEKCAPYIFHFHIHNNDGNSDQHGALNAGTLDMDRLLRKAEQLCPDAGFTLELMEAKPSLEWLRERNFV